MSHRQNIRIAARLRQMAELLEHQGEQGFRSEAYRRAAPVIEGLDRPVDALLSEGGIEALVALPAVGRSIASAISEMVTTGHWQALDQLTGRLDPIVLLMTLPGLGRKSAQRIRDSLHVETLEELGRRPMMGDLPASPA
jgi:DNA polymerase/3'-5' exonuclease PolX